MECDYSRWLCSIQAEFRASFRERAVPDAPELNSARIVSVGLLISDEQEGPFRLDQNQSFP
jgi:hypothetical protein